MKAFFVGVALLLLAILLEIHLPPKIRKQRALKEKKRENQKRFLDEFQRFAEDSEGSYSKDNFGRILQRFSGAVSGDMSKIVNSKVKKIAKETESKAKEDYKKYDESKPDYSFYWSQYNRVKKIY